MSGYLHSGITKQDYEDRAALLHAISVIEARWRGSNPFLLIRLQRLAARIESEAEFA